MFKDLNIIFSLVVVELRLVKSHDIVRIPKLSQFSSFPAPFHTSSLVVFSKSTFCLSLAVMPKTKILSHVDDLSGPNGLLVHYSPKCSNSGSISLVYLRQIFSSHQWLFFIYLLMSGKSNIYQTLCQFCLQLKQTITVKSHLSMKFLLIL